MTNSRPLRSAPRATAQSGTGKELERRGDPRPRRRAGGDPPRPAGRSRRHAQPLHRGGNRRPDRRMPLSAERQSGAGPEIHYKLRWFDRLTGYAQTLLESGAPAVLAGDFNVMPTDLDVYAPSAGSTTPCSGRRCATPIAAWSSRAGPTRCGRSTRMSGSTPSRKFPSTLSPRRGIAHRSPAAEPVHCRPPCRRWCRPRCAGPRKVERSRARLDRACRRKHRISAAGTTPEERSIRLTSSCSGHDGLAAAIRVRTWPPHRQRV